MLAWAFALTNQSMIKVRLDKQFMLWYYKHHEHQT